MVQFFVAIEIEADDSEAITHVGLDLEQIIFTCAQLIFPEGHQLPDGSMLYDSYHCSRYNIQTKRLTESMFRDVMEKAVND